MKLNALNDLPEEPVSHNPAIKKKVMLKKGELPNLTNFSQARFARGQSAAPHAHRGMGEVFFVEAGTGIIRIDGKNYGLKAGVCVAVEPGEVHEVINNGTEELVLTYFGILTGTETVLPG